MDPWKFYDITHRDHVFCNPVSGAKVDEMVELLRLPAGAAVLDIACGKGELLARIVRRYGATGVGVDLSPYSVRDAQRQEGLALVLADGAAHLATVPPGSLDLAMCVGASWVFGGHAATLRALAARTRPGGLVLVGEPFWRREPDPAYLAATQRTRDEFGTHADNVAAGVACALTPLYTIVSGEDDWDRYEGLQWQAAERYAAERPDDPDLPEILARMRSGNRDAYLRWGRDTLGWALYLFLKCEQ